MFISPVDINKKTSLGQSPLMEEDLMVRLIEGRGTRVGELFGPWVFQDVQASAGPVGDIDQAPIIENHVMGLDHLLENDQRCERYKKE